MNELTYLSTVAHCGIVNSSVTCDTLIDSTAASLPILEIFQSHESLLHNQTTIDSSDIINGTLACSTLIEANASIPEVAQVMPPYWTLLQHRMKSLTRKTWIELKLKK